MCKVVGAAENPERDENLDLMSRLVALIGEWDAALHAPAGDAHGHEHQHVLVHCRNRLAGLIGLQEFRRSA